MKITCFSLAVGRFNYNSCRFFFSVEISVYIYDFFIFFSFLTFQAKF